MVTYAQLTHSPVARAKARLREAAVAAYHQHRAGHGVEAALQLVCTGFAELRQAAEAELGQPLHITCSTRRLRDWVRAYETHGLDGLVEQKIGRVGRKAVAAELPEMLRDYGMAVALESGSVAKAARMLSMHPDLPAGIREHLHGGHHAKAYVAPSLRRALRPAPLTGLVAQGPRAARLHSAFTPGRYDDLRPGEVFTADDMTSNVLCWVEDHSARGWRIAQAQILPVMDVATLRWLNVRVIVRDGGQYSADDIWGLFGDTFDAVGLPTRGFLLEGGHWQAHRVQGERTGISDDDRIGGLRALGLEALRAHDAKGKGMLEGRFNDLQAWLDMCPGYAGRDQRTQLPEKLKAQVAAAKAGKLHPRQFLLHVSALADRVQDAMSRMNAERNDGQILRGQSPDEAWAAATPQLAAIPEEYRWLYRSCMSVVQVTRNGVRVTQGSGPKQVVHYYDNPEILVPRQGSRVVVYWDDRRPEADAVLLDAATRRHLGSARYVRPLSRFSARDAELEAEAQRKRERMLYSRTELRSLTPYLQRRAPIAVDSATAEVGQAIAASRSAAEAREERAATSRQAVRRAGRALTPEDLAAMTEAAPVAGADRVGAEDLEALCAANDLPGVGGDAPDAVWDDDPPPPGAHRGCQPVAAEDPAADLEALLG